LQRPKCAGIVSASPLLGNGPIWIRRAGGTRADSPRDRCFESADSITQNGHLRHAANTAIPPKLARNLAQ
jgi:hypothetical protein